MTRPRVEGEEPICRDCGDGFNNEALCWACIRDAENARDDANARVAVLTAEVESLRSAEADNEVLSRVNLKLTAEVARLRGERDRYLDTLNWAMGTTGYFPGGTAHKPYGWREDMKRMAAIRYDGEKYVAALALPTTAPEAKE